MDAALKMIAERQSQLVGLKEQREALLDELDRNADEIEGAIFGRTPKGNGKNAAGRIVGEQPLSMVVADILHSGDNESMTAREITEEALANGWETSSDNPRSIVGQILSQDEDFIGLGHRPKKWHLRKEARKRLFG